MRPSGLPEGYTNEHRWYDMQCEAHEAIQEVAPVAAFGFGMAGYLKWGLWGLLVMYPVYKAFTHGSKEKVKRAKQLLDDRLSLDDHFAGKPYIDSDF